ncbi:hypothetical protein SAMN05216271_0227 [Halopseudomonas sabulinigri]|uniref:Uncharacterized protein n=1 Tax=Halopseudomonas sabulinigri TaxID=472181 RepID=A0A1H1LGW7_9GAMM|nr:hypothetical protein SAMN05216271_0227 [Halopseudomonas sabulinigri]
MPGLQASYPILTPHQGGIAVIRGHIESVHVTALWQHAAAPHLPGIINNNKRPARGSS